MSQQTVFKKSHNPWTDNFKYEQNQEPKLGNRNTFAAAAVNLSLVLVSGKPGVICMLNLFTGSSELVQ